jgi:hypothetical protein
VADEDEVKEVGDDGGEVSDELDEDEDDEEEEEEEEVSSSTSPNTDPRYLLPFTIPFPSLGGCKVFKFPMRGKVAGLRRFSSSSPSGRLPAHSLLSEA